MKRLLSLTTLLLLAVASFAASTHVEVDGIYYNIYDSDCSVTYQKRTYNLQKAQYEIYSNYKGDVVIPEEITYNGKSYKVTSIGDHAFYNCEKLTSVSIPNNVDCIYPYAFEWCYGLTSIVIPESVTKIYESAFQGTTFNSVTLNSTSALNAFISSYANYKSVKNYTFGGKKISIGDDNFSYGSIESVTFSCDDVTIGSRAFYNDKKITSVDFTPNVKNLSIGTNAFYGTTWYNTWYDQLQNGVIYINNIACGYKGKNSMPSSITLNNNTVAIGGGAFEGCTNLMSIYIPSGVQSIGKAAFSGCTELTTVNIPNNVTNIADETFKGCTNLTAIDIPNSITSIEQYAFEGCTSLTTINIPDNVTIIGDYAFSGCKSFTSIIIPESVTSIGGSAFANCSNLTNVNIPSSVTSIGSNVFSGCTALTDVLLNSNAIASNAYSSSSSLKNIFGTQVKTYTIGDNVISIGNYAFYGCSGLTSITIPSSVTSIGSSAFSGCSGLTSITIPSSVTSIGSSAFSGCSGLTSITIPSSITTIGSSAFYGCSGLSRVTINSNDIMSIYYTSSSCLSSVFGSQVKEYIIGEGITSIGGNAFYNCRNMTSVNLPNSLTDIGYSAFYGCSSLNAITIPDNATNISYNAFEGCAGLTSIVVGAGNTMYDSRENCNALIRTSTNTLMRGCQATTIPANVTSIYSSAFSNCVGLSSIDIPESVISIGDNAFNGCADLSTAILPNNIRTIASSSFPNKTKLYVNTGTQTLLNLWKNNYANVYETGTDNLLPAPFLSALSTTQTTAKVKINNKYEGYNYMYDSKLIYDDTFVATGFSPASSNTITVSVSYAGISYSASVTAKTIGIYPTVIGGATSASSIFANGAYTSGDAVFVKEVFKCNGKEVEGKSISVNGLNPNTSYNVEYTITVAYGDNNQYTTSFTGSKSVKTNSLTLTTEQPKVVSMGNVIVSATTNVDPEEKNVGFEWRREDWSSTFASQSGAAVVLDGTMEGYIRNLYTGKLWNYRAYYLSDSGTYYYGDWVGIDPTNTSYFEPTVHTYADISTSGKVALIRGYVLNGTDKITVQGFKYWKTANKGNSLDIAMEGESQVAAVSVPADAITETVAIVGAGQQLMNATLKDLDYGSTYQCVAFATTSENETFYGEVQSFTTEADPTGIEGVKEDAGNSKPATVVACYDIDGKQLSAPQKGLNILKMSDGTTRKVVR